MATLAGLSSGRCIVCVSHKVQPAPCISTVSLIELIFVKLRHFSVPCFSQDEVNYAIHVLCTS